MTAVLRAVKIGLVAALMGSAAQAGVITIGIGHQSTVTNTVPGGIIMEKLGLLQKHLPHDGEYADAEYRVEYRDYASGPPITNEMIAGRLQFGVMGDYPLIVNGATFQANGQDETRMIAITGYNLNGTGNGVVVPVASEAQSLEDLAGKTISTPFGSAAWGMLLQVLHQKGLSDQIGLANQAPPVGVNNIATGRIDAHADFTPWSEVMEFRGTGRKIYDGGAAGIPTFHGTVVTKSFLDKHPRLVAAYLDALLEAQAWIRNDPLTAAIKVSEWTGVEKEVLYLYFSAGGISTFEASLKPQWIDALKSSHTLLAAERDVPPLDFDRWVDPAPLAAAYAAEGQDYAALAAQVVDGKTVDPASAVEVWTAEDRIARYASIAEMFTAIHEMQGHGAIPRAVYVHDAGSGLKLFANRAFYVGGDAGYSAYLGRNDAVAAAARTGGSVSTYDEVLAKLDS